MKRTAVKLAIAWTLGLMSLVACQDRPQGPQSRPEGGAPLVLQDTPGGAAGAAGAGGSAPEEPQLTPDRLLRRLQLTLLSRPPTDDERAALKAAQTETAREAFFADLIEKDLASKDFYSQLIRFAHDWFKVGAHNEHANISHSYFTGHLAIETQSCKEGTLHAGALGLLNNYQQYGDPPSICDDPKAPTQMIEPWWASGTQIKVIGRAASAALKTSDGKSFCGKVSPGDRANMPASPECGCGPNMVWCTPGHANATSFDIYTATTSRRLASEEVARLFAHMGWHDRSLSDLLVGNYSVAPLWLKHMYVRAGRNDPGATVTDSSRWFDAVNFSSTPSDPLATPGSDQAWHEFVPEALFPALLSLTNQKVATGAEAMARSYTFDPRVDMGEPKGIPFAGAFTTLVGMASFARERVRAARWLEAMTCRDFTPPSGDLHFPPYQRDPATEGNCLHCHTVIDPAAIHFKRWGFASGMVLLGGIGPARLSAQSKSTLGQQPWVRWQDSYAHDTVMTPVSEAQMAQNPDAIFLDFLTPDRKLFGQSSDGTIGPLGFGKILLQSGEFDRCAVRRIYQRYVGGKLDPGEHAGLIDSLTKSFVAGDRKLRPFVRELLKRPEFRKGL